MIIRSLHLENFKKFTSLDLKLSEGLNVVKGPNESGKSTLMLSILAVLYWRPNSSRREVRMCSSWGGEDGFRLGMTADSDRGEWKLAKDFTGRTVILEHQGRRIVDLDEVDLWIAEETGLPGETVFKATAGIRQDDVENIVAGKDDLERNLQASVTGGGEGISARDVISAMQKARADLARGVDRPAKSPGALAAGRARLQTMQEEASRMREQVESLHRARRRDKEIETDLAAKEEGLRAAFRLQETFREQTELEMEVSDQRERLEELDQTLGLWQRREELVKERSEKYSKLEEALGEKREWLDRAEVRRQGLNESVERLEVECSRMEEFPDQETPRWPGLLAGAIVLMVAGLIGGFFIPWLFILVPFGIVLAVIALQQTRTKHPTAKSMAIISLNEQLQNLRLDRSDLEQSIKAVVSEAGAASMDNFEEIKLAYFKLMEDLREVENKLEVLSRGQARQDLEKEMDELAVSRRLSERQLEELRKNLIDPLENQKAKVRSETLAKEVEELKREKMRLEYQLEQSGEKEENLLSLEEEISALAEELQVLERRVRAYDLASEWMEQALSKVVQKVKDDVQARVGGMVSSITNGRYQQVRLIEDSFKLEAYSSDKGGVVAVAELSRGTIDQVYLSARLALMESICGEHHPPLILDDPLVTFDPGRLDRAMQLLKEFARDYQVLLFTCSNQYDVYADNVIDLTTF